MAKFLGGLDLLYREEIVQLAKEALRMMVNGPVCCKAFHNDGNGK
jgi:hypothetical protein